MHVTVVDSAATGDSVGAMRIPPSVIVMSLVTAVPFGLAIRDSLRHHEPATADDSDDDLDLGGRRAALKEFKAQQREADERKQLREAEQTKQLDGLFGAQPASLGGRFQGVQLGALTASFDPEAVRSRIDTELVHTSFDVDGAHLLGVTVELGSEDLDSSTACVKLREVLGNSWGPGHDDTWQDAATHQRALLQTDYCRLRFERYKDAPDWVAAVPFELIGAPTKRLTDTLGAVETYDDGAPHWRADGLAGGDDPTSFEAVIRQGKIVGIKVNVDGDPGALETLRAALETKLHAKPVEEPDVGYHWKRKPVVYLSQEASHVSLMIGTMSWD